jgi:tetratricopeptide (TPR) repeat protein
MYCSKSCQVVAWKSGYKMECTRLAQFFSMNEKQNLLNLQRRLANLLSEGHSYTRGASSSMDTSRNAQKAIQKFEQAKKLAEELGDLGSQWNVTFQLKVCFSSLGAAEKAMHLYEKCLEISKEKAYRKSNARFMVDEAIVYHCMGANSIEMGENEKGLKFLQDAMRISKRSGDVNTSDPALLGVCCTPSRFCSKHHQLMASNKGKVAKGQIFGARHKDVCHLLKAWRKRRELRREIVLASPPIWFFLLLYLHRPSLRTLGSVLSETSIFVGPLLLCSDSVLKGSAGLSSQIHGQVCILLQQLRLRKDFWSVTLEDDG